MMRRILFLFFAHMLANAQQPFLTDDADVAAAGHFHLELLTERDWLQDTSYPLFANKLHGVN